MRKVIRRQTPATSRVTRCSSRLVALMMLASMACSLAEAQSTTSDALQVHKVKEKPPSEGMARIAMQELGCDACEDFEFDSLPGKRAVFLMNPQPAVYIDVRDVKELVIARQSPAENSYTFQLSAHLTDDAAAEFDATARPPFLLGITLFRGQKLGIGPLVAPGGLFQLGVFATQAEAESVGRKLGLEPKLIRPEN